MHTSKTANSHFVFRLLLQALFLAAACFAAVGTPWWGARPAQAQESTATYLIQFQPSVSEAERAAWLAAAGAELVTWLPQINVAEVRLADNALAADLDGATGIDFTPVVYVEQDVVVSGEHVITDPGYTNPEQNYIQSYAQRLLRVASAWNVNEGSDKTIIAIVDTGIDATHPDLKGRVLPGYDFINTDADAADDHGHGTHVAGIAAAGLNGVGVVGVCPRCSLLPVKVLNNNNSGSWSSVAKGILYAVDHGASVINLSLGATLDSPTLDNAVEYARQHDVVVVAAAGNAGKDTPFYPAAIPFVVAVGGTDRNDQHWAMSNYGDWVDVVAPANGIYSDYRTQNATASYAYMSGTSMASPFVAGLAALIRSQLPKLPAPEVGAMIAASAVDLGTPGKDSTFGAGRVSALNAIVAANNGVEPPPDIATAGETGGMLSYKSRLYLAAVSSRKP